MKALILNLVVVSTTEMEAHTEWGRSHSRRDLRSAQPTKFKLKISRLQTVTLTMATEPDRFSFSCSRFSIHRRPMVNVSKLKYPPVSLLSKPIYYQDPNNHKEYFFSIVRHDSKTKLMKYDIENDSYEVLGGMDKWIPRPTVQFIHPQSNKLYAFYMDDMTRYDRANIYICDLTTTKWEILPNAFKTDHHFNTKVTESININGEIHILYHNKVDQSYCHSIFDPNSNEIRKIATYKGNSCAAYSAALNQFVIVAERPHHKEWNHKVWSWDMNQTTKTWKECAKYFIPHCSIKVMIPYNDILVCICSRNSIWCFDMIENKFYASTKYIYQDIYVHKEYLMSTNGGRYCYYYDGKDHFRIDLFDACPEKLQTRMKGRNMKRCYGYCREKEMKFKIIMPDCLKTIVFQYFMDLPK